MRQKLNSFLTWLSIAWLFIFASIYELSALPIDTSLIEINVVELWHETHSCDPIYDDLNFNSDGFIVIEVISDLSGLLIEWSEGTVLNNGLRVEGLKKGPIDCTISDSLGCSIDTTFVIPSEQISIAPLKYNEELICGNMWEVTVLEEGYSQNSYSEILEAGVHTISSLTTSSCLTSGSFEIVLDDETPDIEVDVVESEFICNQGVEIEIDNAHYDLELHLESDGFSQSYDLGSSLSIVIDNLCGGVYQGIIEEDICDYAFEFELPVGTTAVGIDESSLLSNIELFPNPVSVNSFLQLKSLPKGEFDVSVLDIEGRVLRSHRITEETELSIPLHSLSAGIYFLQISNQSESLYKQIVIH